MFAGYLRKPFVVLTAAAALALSACGSDDKEDATAETFYEGETVTVVVPFGEGGGSDLAGRFYAEWLSKTLPGNPKTVVINQDGGGGVVAFNEYAKTTEHDGLTLIMGSSTPHSLYVYDSPTAEYDLKDFKPIVATPTGNLMYVSPDTGVQEPGDLLNEDVQLEFPGIVPVGGDLYKVMPLLLLDVNVNETWGYESSGAAAIAFDQGEANVDVASGPNWTQDVQPKIESGDAIPLLATGQIGPDGSLERDPLAPDLPTTAEVYEELYGEQPSGEMWDSYLLQTALVNTLGRTLWVHGDAPAAAIEALETTVASWETNEEYLAANAELNGADYTPNTGADLESLVQQNIFEVPQENIDWLAAFVKEKYDVDLADIE